MCIRDRGQAAVPEIAHAVATELAVRRDQDMPGGLDIPADGAFEPPGEPGRPGVDSERGDERLAAEIEGGIGGMADLLVRRGPADLGAYWAWARK